MRNIFRNMGEKKYKEYSYTIIALEKDSII